MEKFLQSSIVKGDLKETLAVGDAKLGGLIKEKLGIRCEHNATIQELIRGLRMQMESLLTGKTFTNLSELNIT